MLSFTDTTLGGELEHRQPLLLGRGGKIRPLLRSADISLSRNQHHLQCGRQNKVPAWLHRHHQVGRREGAIGALRHDFMRYDGAGCRLNTVPRPTETTVCVCVSFPLAFGWSMVSTAKKLFCFRPPFSLSFG